MLVTFCKTISKLQRNNTYQEIKTHAKHTPKIKPNLCRRSPPNNHHLTTIGHFSRLKYLIVLSFLWITPTCRQRPLYLGSKDGSCAQVWLYIIVAAGILIILKHRSMDIDNVCPMHTFSHCIAFEKFGSIMQKYIIGLVCITRVLNKQIFIFTFPFSRKPLLLDTDLSINVVSIWSEILQ